MGGDWERHVIKKKLGGEMEVVGRAEAFLVAEELDELGVELGGSAEVIVTGKQIGRAHV